MFFKRSLAALCAVLFCVHAALAQDSSVACIQCNNEGVKALVNSDFALAIRKLEECRRLYSSYELGRKNLALAYNNYGLSLCKDNPNEALENLQKALSLDPNPVTQANITDLIARIDTGDSTISRKTLDEKAKVNVKFGGDVEKKFPCLKVVLNQLLETLGNGVLGDTKFWLLSIPTTGTVKHDKFFQVAAEMRRYLTDGKLQIVFRPDPNPPRLGRAGFKLSQCAV